MTENTDRASQDPPASTAAAPRAGRRRFLTAGLVAAPLVTLSNRAALATGEYCNGTWSKSLAASRAGMEHIACYSRSPDHWAADNEAAYYPLTGCRPTDKIQHYIKPQSTKNTYGLDRDRLLKDALALENGANLNEQLCVSSIINAHAYGHQFGYTPQELLEFLSTYRNQTAFALQRLAKINIDRP